MRNALLAVIATAGMIGISASAQAAPANGMAGGIGLSQDDITQVRLSPRERMHQRMMRERAMRRREMRRR